MAKKQKIPVHVKKLGFLPNATIALLILVVAGVVGYYIGLRHNNPNAIPSQNKVGYVISQEATDQVTDFYRQYINSSTASEFRRVLLNGYGSKNLVFYDAYYQHGFDPIVCSSVMPIKVNVSHTIPGPVATVDVAVEYPDHSTAALTATVVINNEGLKIDSITCPGARGNLPPSL